ncbi:Undecaprenyl-phosphate N-acetylglucosaminyl 1-phosphate transferase [Photobacterium marinum]|uniref:Undecaprenyl-phosphate alpha-N-acetylglucosaminyl 1-phosphate transferase n=1 Tax=Photobacterium marinum TaxID=1056511 RepID=L8J8K2_9GAMM|nr:UDP-N-acetylglucosamine--undecaprenyl-phosphate N-acetylglucosaminephosphotransferase [Photobacterium marinum]ELR63762.1 Undecaprenyl-phosphate N-acetylglucosaminyl 1-phosphate transferase [Photobacterium marinum]
MDIELALIFATSFCSLFVLRKFAKRVDLVDIPSARKQHQGAIPLVGGIGIFLTAAIALIQLPTLTTKPTLYLLCASVLVIIGAIDDKYDISFKTRLLIQLLMSALMISVGNLYLSNLGNLLGWGTIELVFPLGCLITVLATIGAINAFNMVDGIDGLLGGLSTVTFASLGYLFWLHGQDSLFQFCLVIVVATLPYIMLNLGFPFGRRYKIFMGDAGSVFIGFTVVWLLIVGSQGENTAFRPVTALWIIALPLMDMATIMIRRVKKGHSPFKPDREHLHHICQRIGLSPKMTLMAICTLATTSAYIGILGEQHQVSESIMFCAFITLFVAYFSAINYIWRLTAFLRKVNVKVV